MWFPIHSSQGPAGSEAIGAYLGTTECIHRTVADIASAYADQDHARSAPLSTTAVWAQMKAATLGQPSTFPTALLRVRGPSARMPSGLPWVTGFV
jgi:hypothetical protein